MSFICCYIGNNHNKHNFAGCIDQTYDAFINIYRYALLNYLLEIIVDRLFTIEIIEFLYLDSIPKKQWFIETRSPT